MPDLTAYAIWSEHIKSIVHFIVKSWVTGWVTRFRDNSVRRRIAKYTSNFPKPNFKQPGTRSYRRYTRCYRQNYLGNSKAYYIFKSRWTTVGRNLTEHAAHACCPLQALQCDADGVACLLALLTSREHQKEAAADAARILLLEDGGEDVEQPVPTDDEHLTGKLQAW